MMAQRIITGFASTILGRIIRRKNSERRPFDEKKPGRRRHILESEPGPFDFCAIFDERGY